MLDLTRLRYLQAVDLHHVLSEPGTLIANRVERGYIASVISYNKGASWNRLPLPDKSKLVCIVHLPDPPPCQCMP